MKGQTTVTALRAILRAEPFSPFDVKTAHGTRFRVDGPKSGMISPIEDEAVFFDSNDRLHIVAMEDIVELKPVGKTRKRRKR